MKKTTMQYDAEGDVLYISFGEPKLCISEQVDDGIFLRYADDTNELNGITIVNFSQNVKGINQLQDHLITDGTEIAETSTIYGEGTRSSSIVVK